MGNKRYSPALKDKYDGVGKRLAKEILRDLVGATLITDNHKEDSGDFTAGFWDQKYQLPKGGMLVVEPEMKDSKWWGLEFASAKFPWPFKYDTMDIPFRKAKNKADLFIVISTCEQFAWLVDRDVIEKHLQESGGKPKIKVTIYEPSGGSYYSTPVGKGIFTQRVNGKWCKWSNDGNIRCTT